MPAWKIGERICGFRVERMNDVPHFNASYWKLVHENTGATLYYSDRDDGQMMFSVGFRTLPENDTGVFHIIEHSALDGSDAYPLKEPFVNLIKTSMAVDLNAMTYNDQTLYYFISTNEQDYMNMMSVYLDGVFHPLFLKNPLIFEKEAWHLEPDGQGGLGISGVVFNEMQGHDLQPGTALWEQAEKQLFPNMYYRFNSGGDPACIHELTYEAFKETYERFYGVDNAIFYLSGRLSLDQELAQIDRVLSTHTPPKYPRPAPPALQTPVVSPDGVTYYQLGENEESALNTRLLLCFVLGDGAHPEGALAFSLLSHYLAENTESPLSRAVLDAGVGQDFAMEVESSTCQPFVCFSLNKSDPEQAQVFRSIVLQELSRLVTEGLDAARLTDLLNSHETDCRRASLSVQSGFRIMEAIFRTHVQRGEAHLEDHLAMIRQHLAENPRYFEDLIDTYILHSHHWALTQCIPSRTLAQEKKQAMDAWLQAQAQRIQATPGAYEALETHFAAFNTYLTAPDSPEAEASIPRLTPADIDTHVACKDVEQDTLTVGDLEISSLTYLTDTDGMVLASLLFDLSGLAEEDLFYVGCIKDALLDLPTRDEDVQALTARRTSLHANLFCDFHLATWGPGPEEFTPYLRLNIDVPEENLAPALELLSVYMTQPVFDRTILQRLFSNTAGLKSNMIYSGHVSAIRLAESSLSVSGVYKRHITGLTAYRRLYALATHFDQEADALIQGMTRVCHTLFQRVKPLAHLTGSAKAYETWRQALSHLPIATQTDAAPAHHPLTPDAKVDRALIIPSEVNYCAQVFALSDAQASYSPTMAVVTGYLYSTYFWDEIRAKGGAYGAMINAYPHGLLSLVSYRDPRVNDTYAIYDHLPDWLEAHLPEKEDIGSLIVSALSGYFAPQSPIDKGYAALHRYLAHRTAADRQADMEAILHTQPQDFAHFAHVLRRLLQSGAGVRAMLGGQAAVTASALFEDVQEL